LRESAYFNKAPKSCQAIWRGKTWVYADFRIPLAAHRDQTVQKKERILVFAL